MQGAGAAVQPPPHQVVFAGNLSQAKRGHVYRCAETPVQHRLLLGLLLHEDQYKQAEESSEPNF